MGSTKLGQNKIQVIFSCSGTASK